MALLHRRDNGFLYNLMWCLSIMVRWPILVLYELVGHFWKPMKDVSKDVVLITGGGSGIGRLMAERFSKLGSTVVLWDINGDALKEVAADLSQRFTNTVSTNVVNVSDRSKVYAAAEQVVAQHGAVTILINNAGIVSGQPLLDTPDEKIELTMQVNIMAHFWITKAFLPGMLESRKGHIVTIASTAGHVGVPGLVDYCASKFAAVGFDESLRMEFAKIGQHDIKTTCVCPYFIDTGMFTGTKTKFPLLMPILTPKYAVDKIMSAIRTNQAVLIMPKFLYLSCFVRSIFPTALFDETVRFLGACDTMDEFKGRKQD